MLSERETVKTAVIFWKEKIMHEAEQNREHIMDLKQKVAKLQDHESKSAASGDQDI